jgi:DNA-binding transcriptional LysR family regulator
MDTNRIRQFCALVENGNLRRTADLLGISHSGLSKSLHTLENEINLRLILPQGRGLVISEAGLKFYEKAKKLLEYEKEIFAPEVSVADIKIACGGRFSTYLFSRFVFEFKLDSFLVMDASAGDLDVKLINHQVDYIITMDPVLRKGVHYDKVGASEFSVFANNNQFNKFDFSDLPFVVPVMLIQDFGGNEMYQDGFSSKKERFIKYRVQQLETALEVVRCGEAVIYIPNFLAKLHNEKYQTKFHLHELKNFQEFKKKKNIYLGRRETSEEGSVHKKIAKVIRSL